MTPKTKIYNEAISSCLNVYLELFSDEVGSHTRLEKQLAQLDPAITSRKNFVGHLTASGLYYDYDQEKVLLVHHRSLDLWIQPGGHLEGFEMPSAGALREFEEETGIENIKLFDWHHTSGVPIDIDTHFIPENKSKGELDHYHHDFLYLLIGKNINKDRPQVEFQENELKGFCWVTLKELLEGDFESKLKRTASKVEKLLRN